MTPRRTANGIIDALDDVTPHSSKEVVMTCIIDTSSRRQSVTKTCGSADCFCVPRAGDVARIGQRGRAQRRSSRWRPSRRLSWRWGRWILSCAAGGLWGTVLCSAAGDLWPRRRHIPAGPHHRHSVTPGCRGAIGSPASDESAWRAKARFCLLFPHPDGARRPPGIPTRTSDFSARDRGAIVPGLNDPETTKQRDLYEIQ